MKLNIICQYSQPGTGYTIKAGNPELVDRDVLSNFVNRFCGQDNSWSHPTWKEQQCQNSMLVGFYQDGGKDEYERRTTEYCAVILPGKFSKLSTSWKQLIQRKLIEKICQTAPLKLWEHLDGLELVI